MKRTCLLIALSSVFSLLPFSHAGAQLVISLPGSSDLSLGDSTRYNDYVIRQIISMYKDQNTVDVYLSDHGEEVYDYRENFGRDDWGLGSDPRQVLHYQYMVPFMVWCSDKYAARHPANIKQLRGATDRPAMLDNVCQLLFHLSGLQTPFYHPQRDILSPD